MAIHLGRTFNKQQALILLICLILLTGCIAQNTSPVEPDSPVAEDGAQPYFGLEFPASSVTRFAPSIFHGEMHSTPIFTPDGREVYWSMMGDPEGVRYMKIENGAWTDPAPAPFDRRKRGDSPFISADGSQLLYLVRRISGLESIWLVEREDGGWGNPQELPEQINQYGAHWQASLADNGNLYFGSRGQIYLSRFEDGAYSEAEVLDLPLSHLGHHAGSPFIASDESYLIFDIVSSTFVDLYITFKNDEDGWDEPIPMEVLNSPAHDLYANVSPDGRFIMFLSGRSGALHPYWVDASIIDELRPE